MRMEKVGQSTHNVPATLPVLAVHRARGRSLAAGSNAKLVPLSLQPRGVRHSPRVPQCFSTATHAVNLRSIEFDRCYSVDASVRTIVTSSPGIKHEMSTHSTAVEYLIEAYIPSLDPSTV